MLIFLAFLGKYLHYVDDWYYQLLCSNDPKADLIWKSFGLLFLRISSRENYSSEKGYLVSRTTTTKMEISFVYYLKETTIWIFLQLMSELWKWVNF